MDQHLQTVTWNRKRRAKKAAETRQAQAKKIFYFCEVCEEVYEDETQELANWIGYDNWFHWHCVNITNEPANFLCSNCT